MDLYETMESLGIRDSSEKVWAPLTTVSTNLRFWHVVSQVTMADSSAEGPLSIPMLGDLCSVLGTTHGKRDCKPIITERQALSWGGAMGRRRQRHHLEVGRAIQDLLKPLSCRARRRFSFLMYPLGFGGAFPRRFQTSNYYMNFMTIRLELWVFRGLFGEYGRSLCPWRIRQLNMVW